MNYKQNMFISSVLFMPQIIVKIQKHMKFKIENINVA